MKTEAVRAKSDLRKKRVIVFQSPFYTRLFCYPHNSANIDGGPDCLKRACREFQHLSSHTHISLSQMGRKGIKRRSPSTLSETSQNRYKNLVFPRHTKSAVSRRILTAPYGAESQWVENFNTSLLIPIYPYLSLLGVGEKRRFLSKYRK